MQLFHVSTNGDIQTAIKMVDEDNTETFTAIIDGLKSGGSTNCEAGINNAIEALKGGKDKKGGAMIFLTDGVCNIGKSLDDSDIRKKLKDSKIRFTAIAFGYVNYV